MPNAALYSRPSQIVSPAPAEVAAECRAAALAFVNEVARDGGPRDFIAWAARDYRHSTRFEHEDGGPLTLAGIRPDEHDLREKVREARAEIIRALESAAIERGRAPFVDWCVAHGLVRPCASLDGAHGWIPVDAAFGRLRERVLALFAVDWLTNPADYEGTLIVCHLCEAVAFDEVARERGFCAAHEEERSSGIQIVGPTRDERQTG